MKKEAAHPKANSESREKTLFKTEDEIRVDMDTAFKNNDHLKTNTALQMESAKIEFKVI